MEPHATLAGRQRLVARTVLDLRSTDRKYVCQVLLLAASWHRHARSDADMEVLTIGPGCGTLGEFFRGIGVRSECIAPGANDRFSRNSNKIEGASPDLAGRRVLLLDNDTCFLANPADLMQVPDDAIAAAEPGNARVEDEQWRVICEDLGLPLLRRTWVPLNERITMKSGQEPIARERWLYLNSGVVLFPLGCDLSDAWGTHQRTINEHFTAQPHATGAVTTSDQAGFATCVAAHGKFAWLPLRFNYRPPCFCLGLETPDNIRILHFTNDLDDVGSLGVMGRIENYWRVRILGRIDRLPDFVSAAERERRRGQAMDVLERVKSIVREYDLDGWEAAIQRHSPVGGIASR